jgi:NTE family protein
MKTLIDTLLLSGGATHGIVYCGIFKRLQEIRDDEENAIKIDIRKVCCISVGCIFGIAYVMGYTYKEVQDEVMAKSFKELRDIKITNLISKFGIDTGRNIMAWVESIMAKKGFHAETTFEQLYEKTGIHFQVLATNLHTYEFTTFDHVHSPELEVAKAIRMSISIPFVFTAETYNGQVHVDGGLVSNYPIHLFKDDLSTTLGIKILSNDPITQEIKEIGTYTFHVMKCLMIQKEKYTTESKKFHEHTIYIHAGPLAKSLNFSMTKREKIDLIKMGYERAHEYFERLKLENKNADIS